MLWGHVACLSARASNSWSGLSSTFALTSSSGSCCKAVKVWAQQQICPPLGVSDIALACSAVLNTRAYCAFLCNSQDRLQNGIRDLHKASRWKLACASWASWASAFSTHRHDMCMQAAAVGKQMA